MGNPATLRAHAQLPSLKFLLAARIRPIRRIRLIRLILPMHPRAHHGACSGSPWRPKPMAAFRMIPAPANPVGHTDTIFATTRWTMVLDAGAPEGTSRQNALAGLCQAYWPPVYAYIHDTPRRCPREAGVGVQSGRTSRPLRRTPSTRKQWGRVYKLYICHSPFPPRSLVHQANLRRSAIPSRGTGTGPELSRPENLSFLDLESRLPDCFMRPT